jgi:hypothetical protein
VGGAGGVDKNGNVETVGEHTGVDNGTGVDGRGTTAGSALVWWELITLMSKAKAKAKAWD